MKRPGEEEEGRLRGDMTTTTTTCCCCYRSFRVHCQEHISFTTTMMFLRRSRSIGVVATDRQGRRQRQRLQLRRADEVGRGPWLVMVMLMVMLMVMVSMSGASHG